MKAQFQCKNGSLVNIEIDDEDYDATVTSTNGTAIGSFSFALVRYPEDHLLLKRAYLDRSGAGWVRQGIGRKILELVRECSSLHIVARPHDGQTRPDGSHLTGDAPGFVSKMIKEQLLFSEAD